MQVEWFVYFAPSLRKRSLGLIDDHECRRIVADTIEPSRVSIVSFYLLNICFYMY